MHTPKAGQYSLQLHALKQGAYRYTKVGNYLIQSDRGCPDPMPFPGSNSDGRIGDMGGAGDGGGAWVEPVSHVSPLVDWEERSEMKICMKIVKVQLNV